MNFRILLAVLLITFSFTANAAAEVKCDQGPLTKTFGGQAWLLYGCTDDTSLLVMSAPATPTFPFYFTFHKEGDHYRLSGEGTGDRQYTQATYEELKKFSSQQIAALIAEAKKQKSTTLSQR